MAPPQDDLDGLNTLYPVCDHRVTRPQCFKSPRMLGWVRLAVFGLLPLVIVLILVTGTHPTARRTQQSLPPAAE